MRRVIIRVLSRLIYCFVVVRGKIFLIQMSLPSRNRCYLMGALRVEFLVTKPGGRQSKAQTTGGFKAAREHLRLSNGTWQGLLEACGLWRAGLEAFCCKRHKT